MENRYRVEVTIPVWIYMEDQYMQAMDATTMETITNKLADDLEVGVTTFMDVTHWHVALDNPTVTFDRVGDPWEIPIDYVPTGKTLD